MRQRFLTVNMLAHLHGIDADDGMGMVRGANHHGINGFTKLIKHFAPVVVLFRIRKLFKNLF